MCYVVYVYDLARYHMKAPASLSRDEQQAYLYYLVIERKHSS